MLFICFIFLFFVLTLSVCWSLCDFWAHGWVTVSASLPCGRFCPYLGWGVTSSHLFGPIASMFNNNYYCDVVIERLFRILLVVTN